MEKKGFGNVKIAINISGIQLTDENFPNFEIEGDKMSLKLPNLYFWITLTE
jgi:hypothetical protein